MTIEERQRAAANARKVLATLERVSAAMREQGGWDNKHHDDATAKARDAVNKAERELGRAIEAQVKEEGK